MHFINKYDQKEINYPSRKYDLKRFGKTNVKIALNMLYVKQKRI